jgi:hypothetical protein
MIPKLVPTLHKPIPMNTRVSIPMLNGSFGRVVGIASMHVIFCYIVLLDDHLEINDEVVSAVSISGTELVSEDGKTNWRL